MSQKSRKERLIVEQTKLAEIQSCSSIFRCEPSGDPPDRYTIEFHGRGVCRDLSPQAQVELIEEHRCELRLPFSFPARPPNIRWLSPIFHPNVSFGGFISLRDIGLHWDREVGLDMICERLWDVARLAYLDLDKASNFAAKTWFQRNDLARPVDHRPLLDRTPSGGNVVRYQRRGAPPPQAEAASDVLFIGPDTAPPIVPPRSGRFAGSDDDVFYIGDD